jgi:hypothetical protein
MDAKRRARMKKRILVVSIFIIIALGFSTMALFAGPGDFKPGSEPDGWEGVRWGIDISSFSGLVYLSTDRGTSFYSKPEEYLNFFSCIAKKVEFAFCGSKFCGVFIVFENDNDGKNWEKLGTRLFEIYGEGQVIDEDHLLEISSTPLQGYDWNGNGAYMRLTEELNGELWVLIGDSGWKPKN